jgi:putative ABC transport system permease protein
MARSFISLLQVDPGFDAENLLTFEVNLPPATYDAERLATFNRRFASDLQAIPGVTSASAAFAFPFQDQAFGGRYGPSEALADESLYGQADYRITLPGYFETIGTRLLAGRLFTATEHDAGLPVAVIDDVVARAIAPDGSAIGRQLVIRTGGDPVTVEVIGIVAHERAHTLSGDEIETVYLTWGYLADSGLPFSALGWLVRTTRDPAAVVSQVRQALASIDRQVPVARVETMASKLNEARTSTRFALVLIGAFGVVGLILTSVGLYGVLASVVRHKTSEIGLRIALGARRGSVVWMVVRQGLILTTIGLVGGLIVSAWATTLMANLLVGVEPNDPLTLAGIVVLFLVVAAAACFVPARRATRVDPLTALRAE